MNIAITHSTTACMLLELGSLRILTDPVFDTGRRSYQLGPAAHATRYVGPAVDPQSLRPLNAALVSHAHHLDNLDESGHEFLSRVPSIITGTNSSERAGPNAIRLPVWQSTTLTGPDNFTVKITATPALHGPWILPESHHVVGFVIEFPQQQCDALYISGDTVYFRGMHEIGRRFKIGTALLHLGAVHFWPPWPTFLRFTMGGKGGAKCTQAIKAKKVIPIHYERSVWSHFRESRESYENAFADAGLTSKLQWLQPGERTKIEI